MDVDRDVILYDGQCSFCRWSARQILRWDRRHRLRPVALQDPEADRLLPGMDPEQRMQSWHLVTGDGEIHSAGAAIAPLLRRLPGGGPFAAIASAFPTSTERLYRLASRHRGTLAKLGARADSVRPGSSAPD